MSGGCLAPPPAAAASEASSVRGGGSGWGWWGCFGSSRVRLPRRRPGARVRVAMVVLYRLAALDLPRRRAERAVLLTAIFPFSFFFGAVYTESTFLLFTVLSFYCMRTGRWAAASASGAVATATRVTGVLLCPA